MDQRTDRLLGRVALSLSILLVVALIATAGRLASLPILDKLGWRPLPSAPYAAGDTLDLPEATYRPTAFTLVLFARSSCEACRASMALHQALAKLVAARSNARMVLSSPVKDQSSGAEVAYAREIGLEASAVLPWGDRTPRVKAVPTLVLVNDHGIVIGAWQGAGSAADRQRMLDTIRNAIGR